MGRRVTREHWAPDGEVAECTECYRRFGLFRRRHHCRACGQIFCGRCLPRSLKLDPATATVDFAHGVPSKCCNLCYESERDFLEGDGAASDAGRQRAGTVSVGEVTNLQATLKQARQQAQDRQGELEELQRHVAAQDERHRQLEQGHAARAAIFAKQLAAAKEEIVRLRGKLLAASLVGTLQKRKSKADGKTTAWKERLCVLDASGLSYFKAEGRLGSIPLEEMAGASPIAGGGAGRRGSAPDQIQPNLMIATHGGDAYEFEVKGGEAVVALWLDQIGACMEAAQNGGQASLTGLALGGGLDDDDEAGLLDGVQALDAAAPFKMGWLHKQPGQTMGFWQRRFFVCAEGYLSYFKAEEDSKPVAKFSLAGSDARVLKVQGRPGPCFQIFVPEKNRIFVVEAEGQDDATDWLNTLKKAAAAAAVQSPATTDGAGSEVAGSDFFDSDSE